MAKNQLHIACVIPVYNESGNITKTLNRLRKLDVELSHRCKISDIICVNDGSIDDSLIVLQRLADEDNRIQIISFTRNFGKEVAMTAGLKEAVSQTTADAVFTFDADGQHPIDMLGDFLDVYDDGALVVVGRRTQNSGEGYIKRTGSRWFYRIMLRITHVPMVPGSTDFRLIDREVLEQFSELTEHNRLTRGLIDWLGYPTEYISFEAAAREEGKAGYGLLSLIRLAVNSFVSLSIFPLKLSGYLGLVIMSLATVVGLLAGVDFLLHDPFGWKTTGTGFLAVAIIWLVGLVLSCLGLVALYIAHIYDEVGGRPLYVVRKTKRQKER